MPRIVLSLLLTVLEGDGQNVAGLSGLDFEAVDVALFLHDAGDFDKLLAGRHGDRRLASRVSVTHTRKHICDRVVHAHCCVSPLVHDEPNSRFACTHDVCALTNGTQQRDWVDKVLPGSLGHAGQFAFVSELAKADAAQTELAVVRTRTTTASTAIVLTRRELRLALGLGDHRFLSHSNPSFL